MKRTNIIIDDDLAKKGLEKTGLKTLRALVDYALKEVVRRESQAKILKLKGNINWEGNLSKMRRRRKLK